MRPARIRQPRNALTLVELIVVIAIITLIATLGWFVIPSFTGSNGVQRAVDQMSGHLLIARQRAKRDSKPTGLRISYDANANLPTYSILQYIQQPADLTLAGSRCTSFTISQASAASAIVVQATLNNVNLQGASTGAVGTVDQYPIAIGDSLVVNGGVPRRITGILGTAATKTSSAYTTVTLDPNTTMPIDPAQMQPTGMTPYPKTATQPYTTTSANAGPNYYIIRQPRLLEGEDPINLQEKIGVDFTAYPLTATFTTPPLSNAPQAGIDANGFPYYEILFSQGGAVVGQGTPNGFVYLWVRDMSADPVAAADVNVGFSVIIAVQTRSGFISQQKSGPSTAPAASYDPYFFTRDARNSGT